MAQITKGREFLIKDLDSAIARNFERARGLHITTMTEPVNVRESFGESFKNIDGCERVCVGVLASYPGVRSRLYVLTVHDSMDVSEYADLDLVNRFMVITGVKD